MIEQIEIHLYKTSIRSRIGYIFQRDGETIYVLYDQNKEYVICYADHVGFVDNRGEEWIIEIKQKPSIRTLPASKQKIKSYIDKKEWTEQLKYYLNIIVNSHKKNLYWESKKKKKSEPSKKEDKIIKRRKISLLKPPF